MKNALFKLEKFKLDLNSYVIQKLFAELPKGEALRSVTPEQIVGAMTTTVRGMDGVTEEQLAQFRKGVLPLFQKPAGDIEDAGADE